MTKTTFRWEQSGSGGEHGTATYFIGTDYEVTISVSTFKQANALYYAIDRAEKNIRYVARAELLSHIGRIAP